MKTAPQPRVRFVVTNLIRLLLVIAIFISLSGDRRLVFTMAVIGLAMTFVPWIAQTFLKSTIPAEFEVLVLFFIYGVLLYGNVHGFYGDFFWWDPLLNSAASIILGIIGLTILYVLDNEEVIEANAGMISFFAFCFAFSLAGLWEVFEFSLDTLFGFGLQEGGLSDTMGDLIAGAVGSFIVSLFGYFHLKSGKQSFISVLLARLIRRHAKVFRSKKYVEYSSELIEKMLQSGEHETLEFKSTLRKNLHTGELDKQVTHAVLKTITAYLNTKGGVVLVGVDNAGHVIGLENDEFANHDKLKIYVTNILRTHLGNRFLPFISYEVYPVRDRHVLRIDCAPSSRRVFLRWNDLEEFFVRHGPNTLQLMGSDLIDYVSSRFS